MFLFFMPTLYCDVTSAWRLESRTQRIVISAAGVYVELMIALIAAIGWALSGPGVVNAVLFQLMALCGISTILINGIGGDLSLVRVGGDRGCDYLFHE